MLQLILAVALVSLGLLTPATAHAQESRLNGVVRDATGAVLPGVTVAATNQSNGTTRTATSGNDGSYSLALPPGSYTVTATLAGFRRTTQTIDVSGAAPAQLDISMQPGLSEEVTVTAMKRDQELIDVPFSIAAPTEQVLRSRGIEGLEDVAANVAGFSVQNLGPGQSQVAMRGISSGQIVRDQPGVKEQVGTYLDESVISMSLFTPDLDLVDVNRIEVLRGPQGTLFGSGSLAGTVRYITNQPQLGATTGFLELGGSIVGGGSAAGNGKFGFNVPLGERAALRVASYYNRLPGYIDAVQPNHSVKENVNDGIRNGVRATLMFAPNPRLSITQRVVYQKLATDGWNRIDAFNILANPFTTRRTPVTLGERQQFTQLEEDFTDDFVLGDVNVSYDFGNVALTSVSSYGFRDILVTRDATALTASITGGSIGLSEPVYTLDAPLYDATTAKTFTQEVRFSGRRDRFRFPWLAGVFYGRQLRDYGQDLKVNGFEDMTAIRTRGLRAPKDSLYWSDLGYTLDQFALFGETTLSITPRFDVTGGLRYYFFKEDKEQVFDGIFVLDNPGTEVVSQPGETDADGVAPRVIATFKLTDATNLNAQVSRGIRLGGINDPINAPLCTPADLVTFGGRDAWQDETVWDYEVGVKSDVLNGRGSFNVSAFHMEIRDLQATVTAGSCSSRVIFNVPKARSRGLEIDFDAAPHPNFDFAISAGFNDSELGSTLTSIDDRGNIAVVSGIEKGRRLPSVPRFQLALAATYQWQMGAGSIPYVTGTLQHVGSRFTQVGDEDLGTLDLLSFGANTIGGPLTASTFTYDPELPAYSIVNLRAGVRRARWDVSLFVNNVTDEIAYLSFDRERGTRARIGYLTNQPRTFGVTTRFNF